ncbi:hypothetical protein Q5752_003258 [Cryptotrichosporon argae]
MSAEAPKTPWYAHLPSPTARPRDMSPEDLRALMDDPAARVGETFVVVDVRRADLDDKGSAVHPSAINLPAQIFFQTLPAIYGLLHRVPIVVFHCSSSRGRGPRCAGWYQDALDARACTSSAAYVLTGGIVAWRRAYPDAVVELP